MPGTESHALIQTDRLQLIAFTPELVLAMMANDRAAAEGSQDVRFPDPFELPPETGDVLDFFLAMIRADESRGLFLPRLIVRNEDRMVVGSIGVNPPDESGRAMLGYSIYPQFEGNGYASEAARALVDYVLGEGSVSRVIATIPVGHTASERVSERAGLARSGDQIEDEGMTLNVWQRLAD